MKFTTREVILCAFCAAIAGAGTGLFLAAAEVYIWRSL